MSKRNILSLLLAFAMLIPVLAGCGGAADSPAAAPGDTPAAAPAAGGDKTVLRVMIWGSSENSLGYDEQFRKTFPEFAEKCEVEFLVGGQGDDKCAEKMRLALAANESICDINQLNYTQIAEFARAGVLQSLDDIVAPVRDDMLEGFRALTEFEGETLAVPVEIKAKLWFYRKDLFDQAGVVAAEVKTLDDFIAAGKKLQELDPKYMMWSLAPPNPMYQYMMVLSGTDASFSDDQGNFQLTTNPNFRAVLEAYKRLLDEGVVAQVAEWTPDWEKAFADEVLVSYPNATWLSNKMFLPTYSGEAQKDKWEVAQWPSFIGESGGSEAGGSIFVIPSYAENTELAKEYISLKCFDKEGWFAHQAVGGAEAPMLKSWADDPRANQKHFYIGGDYAGEVIKAIDTLKLFPWDPAAQLELDICQPYFDKAIGGELGIDEALASAEADLANQVGNPWDR